MSNAAKSLKILMIGNSFSICVGKNLAAMVDHEKKHNVVITSAYIGGCTLETHANLIREAEKDPDIAPYLINTWYSSDLRKKGTHYGNVNELLKNNKYDIVTIQQGSVQSWDYKFYQPHADELIAYIRKYNPQAEIVIQQTWAYRADAERMADWGFTQSEMSEKVIASYKKFAKIKKFRMIPVGEAVAIARTYPEYKYVMPTQEELDRIVCPDLPARSHDPVGAWRWVKNKDGLRLDCDKIHLNEHGHYLQACVWYSFLFDEDARKITYEPKLSAENCRILRNAAAEAVKKYIKNKGWE